MWQKDKTDANKLAAWTFDTAAKGQPYEATRFDGAAATGKAYTKKITAYDYLCNATTTELLLPEGDSLRTAGVGPTLTSTAAYRIDNTVSQTGSPAVGGLPYEAVEHKYNATGQQITTRGSSYYLKKANFYPQGDLRDLWLGTGEKLIYVTNSYEKGTRRLTGIKVTDDVNSYPLQDLAFTQDDAGNVTSIFDITTRGGAAKPDHQCFTYDGYSRVTEAWTPKTSDCAPAGRTTANVDGSAPYWTPYTYNEVSHYAGYDFDDTDWETIEAGVQVGWGHVGPAFLAHFHTAAHLEPLPAALLNATTDDEAPDGWYSYPLVGTSVTLSVALVQAACGEEVSVSVTGAETLELRLRTDTLLSAFASI
ncbi:hypothetical protein GCM10019016_137110 [Streptomyces prasinosporus]|uniref:Uncharacterized protein n=1 Tax=Streptomyces prasinosporus TaxID=68256 RepID=A0ABP6UJK2_9ACTN|nr:hypothetical protein GCM10010332_00060 [Streptomyces albogriseolus]